MDCKSAEVTFLSLADELRRFRIFRRKVVPKWRQHRDKPLASISQRKDAEGIEDVRSAGDGGKQPVQVVLVDTSREEGDNSEEVAGVRAEIPEHQRG